MEITLCAPVRVCATPAHRVLNVSLRRQAHCRERRSGPSEPQGMLESGTAYRLFSNAVRCLRQRASPRARTALFLRYPSG